MLRLSDLLLDMLSCENVNMVSTLKQKHIQLVIDDNITCQTV